MRKTIQIPINEIGTYKVNVHAKGVIYQSTTVTVSALRFDRIKDIFPVPYENGIFKMLNVNFSDFYSQADLNNSSLDCEYVYQHSGSKLISPLLRNLFTTYSGTSYPWTDTTTAVLVNIITQRYKRKWEGLLQTLLSDYDPLNPYDMEINDSTTNTSNTTANNTNTRSGTSEEKRQGFNSSSYQPDSQYTDDTENTESVNRNTNTQNTRTLTRKGNIGNTAKQDLINKEREVLKWQIIDTLFSDVDDVLCSQIYNMEV